MKMYVFSVFDSKALSFCTPFYVAHPEIARRAFEQAANDPEHHVSKHPQDFTLYCIAEWETDDGKYSPRAQFANHGTGAHFKISSAVSLPLGVNNPTREEA